jgi:hypothetical protein
LKGKVTASRVLTNPAAQVKVESTATGYSLTLDPAVTLNQFDTIVELTMDGPVAPY